jgi:hypothetical protein
MMILITNFVILFRPKSKYIRITKDDFFTNEEHYLSNTPAKAEKACSYDLDDCDIAWLQILNGERACMGEYRGALFCVHKLNNCYCIISYETGSPLPWTIEEYLLLSPHLVQLIM